jgi:hypothetical protein
MTTVQIKPIPVIPLPIIQMHLAALRHGAGYSLDTSFGGQLVQLLVQ